MTLARTVSDIVVIGAGPKAVAIAAKTHVLNELGYGPLRLTLLERREVAASWTGRHGFTTGLELLGTRPEKDVGFPYQSGGRFGTADQQIDAAMLRFSWQRHMVETGEYRRWVDMGAPSPVHRELARYLSWVLERATQGVQLRLATATRAMPGKDGWRVECEAPDGSHEVLVAERGLVLTGPGMPRTLPYANEVAHRIIYPSWTTAKLEGMYVSPTGRICIIGCGESAVSMALWLIRRHGEDLEITFVAPTLPYSRAESFLENSVYSDPQLVSWKHLAEDQRSEFVRRTDRGVMSPAALAQLARHRNLFFVVGRVREIQLSRNGLAKVVVDQSEEVVRHEFDAVAICTGSSPIGELVRLLGDSRPEVEGRLGCSLADERAMMRQIDSALALRGLDPRLHLPALGGLAQGPGFANLSCLGNLSDSILSAYVSASPTRQKAVVAEASRD